MHHKNIKLIVRKQLNKRYPNWNRLNRKTKKEISRKVLAELEAGYDFSQDVVAPHEKLLGIEGQVPAKGIITLREMDHFIEMVNRNNIIRFSSYKLIPYISGIKSFSLLMNCLMTESSTAYCLTMATAPPCEIFSQATFFGLSYSRP